MFFSNLIVNLHLIPCYELKPFKVVPELMQLTEGAFKHPLLRRQERGSHAVELNGRIVLELTERGNLAPELADFFGTTVNAAEDLKDNDAEYDQQRHDGEEGPDQLGMYRKRRSCHKPR
jgi:hypothetical protein